MTGKSAFEMACRRRLNLPRHSTANDGAAVLLRIAALAVCAASLSSLVAPWLLVRFALFSTSAFVGVALQQYSWYTGRVYTECWTDEGFPVVATAVLIAALLGLISLLFSILLPSLTLILA